MVYGPNTRQRVCMPSKEMSFGGENRKNACISYSNKTDTHIYRNTLTPSHRKNVGGSETFKRLAKNHKRTDWPRESSVGFCH